MNATFGPSNATRHRLYEGVLLRLARLPNASEFALRGGMLLRLWFRPLVRNAGDLDLAATFAFDVKETARKLVPLLAENDVGDGIRFDPERFRVDGIWLDTPFPGVRMFAAGEIDGLEEDFSMDITFGETLEPEPILADYPTACGAVARLLVCRPETITGRKLHALQHMGALHWRPKDLNDLRLLLRHTALEPDALVHAIATSFTSRGHTTADARGLLRRPWWARKMSAARWQDFVKARGGPDASGPLARVLAEVTDRLQPTLERLP